MSELTKEHFDEVAKHLAAQADFKRLKQGHWLILSLLFGLFILVIIALVLTWDSSISRSLANSVPAPEVHGTGLLSPAPDVVPSAPPSAPTFNPHPGGALMP